MMFRTHMVIGALSGAALAAVAAEAHRLAGGQLTAGTALILIASAAVGGVMPDIDQPESWIGRRLRLISGLIVLQRRLLRALAWLLRLLQWLPRGIASAAQRSGRRATWAERLARGLGTAAQGLARIDRALRHRGPATHSLLAAVLFALLAGALTIAANRFLEPLGAALAEALGTPALRLAIPWSVPVGMSVGYLSHLVADSHNPQGVEWLFPYSETRYRAPITISTGSVQEQILLSGLLILCGVVSYAGYLRYWT